MFIPTGAVRGLERVQQLALTVEARLNMGAHCLRHRDDCLRIEFARRAACGFPADRRVGIELCGDPDRFTSSKKVGPWVGLTPSRNQSSERDISGGITKAGDVNLRRALPGSPAQASVCDG